jgi:hypothetical protein
VLSFLFQLDERGARHSTIWFETGRNGALQTHRADVYPAELVIPSALRPQPLKFSPV